MFKTPTLADITSTGNINEVIPNLYLGNMWSTDPNILNQYGIDCVLNVSDHRNDMNKGRYKLHSQLVINIDDTPSASEKMLKEVLPKTMRYLDSFIHPEAPSNKKVLVHCAAGISRSATVILAWLMKTYGMNRDKSIQFLQSRRSIIHPNDGFMKILGQWEKYLKRFHNNNAIISRRSTRGSRAYNYPGITNHHLFPNTQTSNEDSQELRQFERQFSVIPSDASTLETQQHGPSYYREFEEKVYSNDNAFKHLY